MLRVKKRSLNEFCSLHFSTGPHVGVLDELFGPVSPDLGGLTPGRHGDHPAERDPGATKHDATHDEHEQRGKETTARQKNGFG